jgi:hypothetical protein
VQQTAAVQCRLREHLEAAFPGYAACFEKLWESNVALTLLRHYDSAQAFRQAGLDGLSRRLRSQDIRFQRRTLEAILAWANQAAPCAAAAACQRRLALDLDDTRQRNEQQVQQLEREICAYLVQTPYVLLLSFPGVNVVSAADFAGEMGPIEHYANAKAITGRAGLFPSRYQSDQVDRANGPLVRCANRKLRAVLLAIADNLLKCNQHFRVLAGQWRAAGKDAGYNHVKVAVRFSRIAYQMVAGGRVFRHPCLQGRGYILEKLLAFQREHGTPFDQSLMDLQRAIEQVPRAAYAEEAKPLADEYHKIRAGRKRGPVLLGDVLPIVLARLGVAVVQSPPSGEADPR